MVGRGDPANDANDMTPVPVGLGCVASPRCFHFANALFVLFCWVCVVLSENARCFAGQDQTSITNLFSGADEYESIESKYVVTCCSVGFDDGQKR